MSRLSLKDQLWYAGFKQTTKQPTLQNVVDAVLEPITRPLRIQVTKAGSHYKARWFGKADCVIGSSRAGAIERLKAAVRGFER